MSLAVRVLAIVFLLVATLRVGTVAGAEPPGVAAASASDASGSDDAASAIGGERTSVVVLGARLLFPSGRGALTAAAERSLGRLVDRLLSRRVAAGSIASILVVGHTDGIGSDADNLRLSERRAASVGAFIAERHPEASIVTEGVGERRPVASDASAEGRMRNRRVEIRVVALERP